MMQAARAAALSICFSFLFGSLNGCALQAREHMERGGVALDQRDLDAALAEYRQAVSLDPNNADAHEKLGEVYREMGDLNKAADSLETAVRLDPFDFKPMFELGQVYQLLDRVAQAIKAYALACELDPKNFDVRSRLAICYQQSGDLDRAIETYKAALHIEPRNAFAWSNLGAVYNDKGMYYEAINAYKNSLECGTPHQPVVLVNLATAHINLERWQAARQTLQTAIRLDPNLSVAHARLAYCWWRENKLDEAAVCYRRAIELDTKNAPAYAGLGVVRLSQYLAQPEHEDYLNEAVECWHTSLEINPDQPKVRGLLDRYRIKQDRPIVDTDIR